jgi:type II secretory pathway component GspD/PulD (secretin)
MTEDEQNVETGVPGIKDLPVVGRLFKVNERAKTRTELMIFVTPNVHRRPEEITWDKMIDVAAGLNEAELIPASLAQREVRKN